MRCEAWCSCHQVIHYGCPRVPLASAFSPPFYPLMMEGGKGRRGVKHNLGFHPCLALLDSYGKEKKNLGQHRVERQL